MHLHFNIYFICVLHSRYFENIYLSRVYQHTSLTEQKHIKIFLNYLFSNCLALVNLMMTRTVFHRHSEKYFLESNSFLLLIQMYRITFRLNQGSWEPWFFISSNHYFTPFVSHVFSETRWNWFFLVVNVLGWSKIFPS